MHAPLFRTLFPRRRFAWLLWLALLLPVAQVVASGHALSHQGVAAAGAEYEGKRALPQHAACALCITAAAMGAGALPSTPPAWPHSVAGHEQPPTLLLTHAPGPLTRAYLSRAPPSSQC